MERGEKAHFRNAHPIIGKTSEQKRTRRELGGQTDIAAGLNSLACLA